MQNIQILDLKQLILILECIKRYVAGGKIVITSSGLKILTKNQISRIRLESDCCVVDGEATLTFKEFDKLLALLVLISKRQKTNAISFKYDDKKRKIEFTSSDICSKLVCVKEEIIEQFIDTEIKNVLVPSSIFNIRFENISDVIDNSSVIIDDQAQKFKLFVNGEQNKTVYIENVSENNTLSNNLKLNFGILLNETCFNQNIIIDICRLKNLDLLSKFTKAESLQCSIINETILQFSANLNYISKNENTKLTMLMSSLKNET